MRSKIRHNIVSRVGIVLVLVAVLLVGSYVTITMAGHKKEVVNAGQMMTNYEDSKAIIIGDKKYLPDPDVYTVLLGGVDKFGEVSEGNSYTNHEQIDFLALLAYDKNKNTCKILMINRDTMMDVPTLGLGGKSAGTDFEQIALSHTYGSGLKDSADNTVDAVESLLGGITVDNYVIMKMDAIPILNDAVGGVPVTFTEDLTAINPAFAAGSGTTLTGDLSLQFVRRRMDVSDGTNLSRIARQEQYINGFYNSLRNKVAEDDHFLIKAFGSVEDYLTTDCDFEQMGEFQEYVKSYPTATMYTLIGEVKQGPEFVEFYPDQGALSQLTVDLFYKPAN